MDQTFFSKVLAKTYPIRINDAKTPKNTRSCLYIATILKAIPVRNKNKPNPSPKFANRPITNVSRSFSLKNYGGFANDLY